MLNKSVSPSRPAVSVVVPVFNRRHLLPRALASVAAQTYRDFELILVDDGSTDSPSDALEACGVPNVRLIRHNENRGAAAARNTGIQAAKGEWIAFLDSDDSWEPEKLALQVAGLDESRGRICVSCTGYHLHRDGHSAVICLDLQPGEFATSILWGCNISPGSSLVAHREVFDKIGLFDEQLGRLEDWDWLLRLSRHYDVAFVPKPLVNVFVETAPVSGRLDVQGDRTLQAISQISRKHFPWIRARGYRSAAKFQSALLTERAARMYYMRRPIMAACYTAAALLCYPARNSAFFRTLWRALRRPYP